MNKKKKIKLYRKVAKVFNKNNIITFVDYQGEYEEDDFQKNNEIKDWKQKGNSSIMVGWHLLNSKIKEPSIELSDYNTYTTCKPPYTLDEVAELLKENMIVTMPTDLIQAYEYLVGLDKNGFINDKE